MLNEILRVVFDSNIFIQFFLNPNSAAAKCLEVVQSGKAELFVSKETLEEIRDVVLRPNILARLPDADEFQIEAFIEYITSISTFIDFVPHSFDFERDPKDEIIIDLAIEAEADYIVSRDKDLLDLMTGYTDECKDFRRRFRGLKIVDPVEFLAMVEK
ncbi:MAG TPA: putative toxin-antitoxin system toxin component, PIN family [Pyrinomonadaceae bacterium]|nr:putative toxin-antitoxin system toxin component, PIN family [Pyrinomonadaceae bacterium]